jgi:hypothetical protein
MKKFLAALLLAALASAAYGQEQPTFRTRWEAKADAVARLARATRKASAPSSSNSITYEGTAAISYASGTFSAVLMDNDEVRFVCATLGAGCSSTASADHLLIYAHLTTYLSCRHDGTDDEAVVNLIYRRTTRPCGDLTCTVWTLLSQ